MNINSFYKAIRLRSDIDHIENISSVEELNLNYKGKINRSTHIYLKTYLKKQDKHKFWFLSWNWPAFFGISFWACYRRIYSYWLLNLIIIALSILIWRGILSGFSFNYQGTDLIAYAGYTTVVLRGLFANAYYVWRVEYLTHKRKKSFNPNGLAILIPLLLIGILQNSNKGKENSFTKLIESGISKFHNSPTYGKVLSVEYKFWWFGI